MDTCSVCGLGVDASSRYCANCGEPLARPGPAPELTGELSPGTRLDERYEVLRALGRGGMGVVYLARDHERDGSQVALKLLPDALVCDPHGLQLLKQEATVAMRLSHPNIVRLHNLEGRTRKYLVMEYVDGGSLADRLLARVKGEDPRPAGHAGPGLSPAEIAPLLDGMAAGLDHAHAERVIHRDMKPGNVLIKRRGDVWVPKIADFGIAREIRELVSRATQQHIAGTPSYMSPEHYRGDKLDPRADQYSLAATVYTLLAARPPFHGGDLSYQILNKEPDAIAGVPASVLAVVRRGMAKNARDRYESCARLALAFGEAVHAVGEAVKVDTVGAHGGGTTSQSMPASGAVLGADRPSTAPRDPTADPDLATAASPAEATHRPPPPMAQVPTESRRRTGAPAATLFAGALALALAAWGAHAWQNRPAPPSPTPLEQARQLVRERKYNQALDALQAVREPTDEHVRDWADIGVLAWRKGEPRLAESAWRALLKRDAARGAVAVHAAAERLVQDGKLDGTTRALEIILEAEPKNERALQALAAVKGESAAPTVLARKPADDARMALAARDWDRLLAAGEKMIVADAGDPAGYKHAARAWFEKGRRSGDRGQLAHARERALEAQKLHLDGESMQLLEEIDSAFR